VKDRLAAYKVPRVFELREQLPRSASGKILRHLIEG
jgi:feruloyl-CoA synthase